MSFSCVKRAPRLPSRRADIDVERWIASRKLCSFGIGIGLGLGDNFGGGAAPIPQPILAFKATLVGSPDVSHTAASFSNTNNAAAFGKCLDLNGTSQWARFDVYGLQFAPGASWTVRGRLRTTSNSGLQVFLSQSPDISATNVCQWYLANNGGTLQATMQGFNSDGAFGTAAIADGAWHDWKLEVTSGTAALLTVDGIASGSAVGTYPAPNSKDSGACIGGFFAGSSTAAFLFAGQLDEISIWDTVTSGGVPTAPYVGNETGLRLLWHFDGDNAQSVQVPRVVATNCHAATAIKTSTASGLSRSRHIARAAITSLRVAFPNWVFGTNVNSVATVTAAIEYNGVAYPLTWHGASSVGIGADSTGQLSDALAVTIPAGDAFFVRSFYTNAAGSIIWQYYSDSASIFGAADTANGEQYRFGATDQTNATGNLTGGTSEPLAIYRPSLIVGTNTGKSYFLIGDSRHYGNIDAYTGTSGDRGQIARAVGAVSGYINFGSPGELASDLVASHERRNFHANYCSHVICEYAANDIISSHSAATIAADLSTIAGYFPNFSTYQTTITPMVSTSDGGSTLGGQTPYATEAVRTALNGLIRAGISGFTGYLEVADIVESARDSGKWKVNYSVEGLHEDNTCTLAIQAALPLP